MKSILIFLVFSAVIKADAFDHTQLNQKPVQGLNQGQVVTADELESHFEVVTTKKNLKIYIYNKEMKLQEVSNYTLTAKTQLNPKKKQENLTLISKGTYFETTFSPKGVKKYDLYLAVKNNKNSKADLLKYTIKIP